MCKNYGGISSNCGMLIVAVPSTWRETSHSWPTFRTSTIGCLFCMRNIIKPSKLLWKFGSGICEVFTTHTQMPWSFPHTLLAGPNTTTNDCPIYFPYSNDDNLLVVGDAKKNVSHSISKMASKYDKKKIIVVSLICSEKIKHDDPLITYLQGYRHNVQDVTILKGMLKKHVVSEGVKTVEWNKLKQHLK